MTPLETEISRRIAAGCEQLSVSAMGARYLALGYRLDRSRDCYSNSRYVSGPFAGQSYPAITTGAKESDTGRSFAHFESRRDENFKAMMDLRQTVFAVTRGRILEV